MSRTATRYVPLLAVFVLGAVVEPWLRAGYRPLRWGDLVEAVALLPLAAAAGLLMTRRRGAPLGPLLAVIAVLFALAHGSDASRLACGVARAGFGGDAVAGGIQRAGDRDRDPPRGGLSAAVPAGRPPAQPALAPGVLAGDGEPVNPRYAVELALHLAAAGVRGTATEALPELTAREREILSLVARGLDNHAIARKLVLSPLTLRNHLTSILAKLGVTDRRAAAEGARQAGITTPGVPMAPALPGKPRYGHRGAAEKEPHGAVAAADDRASWKATIRTASSGSSKL